MVYREKRKAEIADMICCYSCNSTKVCMFMSNIDDYLRQGTPPSVITTLHIIDFDCKKPYHAL